MELETSSVYHDLLKSTRKNIKHNHQAKCNTYKSFKINKYWKSFLHEKLLYFIQNLFKVFVLNFLEFLFNLNLRLNCKRYQNIYHDIVYNDYKKKIKKFLDIKKFYNMFKILFDFLIYLYFLN